MKPHPMKTCIRVHIEPLNLLLSRNPLLLDGNYKIGVLDETQEVANGVKDCILLPSMQLYHISKVSCVRLQEFK